MLHPSRPKLAAILVQQSVLREVLETKQWGFSCKGRCDYRGGNAFCEMKSLYPRPIRSNRAEPDRKLYAGCTELDQSVIRDNLNINFGVDDSELLQTINQPARRKAGLSTDRQNCRGAC